MRDNFINAFVQLDNTEVSKLKEYSDKLSENVGAYISPTVLFSACCDCDEFHDLLASRMQTILDTNGFC